MHYYQHHIGDFIKDTSFLTNEEVGIYLKLLWLYYDTETPLPNSLFDLAMKVNARNQQEELAGILGMFFKLEDNEWHHSRCDKEISHYQQQLNTASKAGKASALKRALNKESTDVERSLDLRSTSVQPTNNHEPITNNHCDDAYASLSGTAFPTCPQKAILDLWKRHLPNLPQPRVWEGSRQVNLKNRWIQAGKPSEFSPQGYKTVNDGLKWWNSFFEHIAKETKLADGFESQGRTWRPDLEWVVNASNFAKIIDGKYDK
jgi:uncharacterized protein YdaU (DUF1376 family)